MQKSHIVESVRSIVRHFDLLLLIHMILRMPARGHIVYQGLKDIFLRHLKSSVTFTEIYFLKVLKMNSLIHFYL